MPLVGVLTMGLHYNVRTAFKKQHGIVHDGPCPDLALLAFCDACMLCQELRELEVRTPKVMTSMMPTIVAAPSPVAMNPMVVNVHTTSTGSTSAGPAVVGEPVKAV